MQDKKVISIAMFVKAMLRDGFVVPDDNNLKLKPFLLQLLSVIEKSDKTEVALIQDVCCCCIIRLILMSTDPQMG